MEKATSIEEMLREKGIYVGTTVGVSMAPLLKTRRDVVVIEKPKARLKENDVALYKRKEQYVLHRVVKVLEDGYETLGDNCAKIERVKEEDILGVLVGFHRKGGNYIGVDDQRYQSYVHFIRKTHPLREICFKLKSFLR